MKHTEFLLVTGDSLEQALKLMKEQLNEKYGDHACKINQMFVLPEARAISTIAAPQANGQPPIKYVVNLVAVVDEEPEFEGLQRNYKTVFDFMNTNRDAFLPLVMGWLSTVSGSIPDELKGKFFDSLNNHSFNE